MNMQVAEHWRVSDIDTVTGSLILSGGDAAKTIETIQQLGRLAMLKIGQMSHFVTTDEPDQKKQSAMHVFANGSDLLVRKNYNDVSPRSSAIWDFRLSGVSADELNAQKPKAEFYIEEGAHHAPSAAASNWAEYASRKRMQAGNIPEPLSNGDIIPEISEPSHLQALAG